MRSPKKDRVIIAKTDVRPGERLRIIMSADNRRCALVYTKKPQGLRIDYGGKTISEKNHGANSHLIGIHPTDGRLAVSTGEPGAAVQVFGGNGNLLASHAMPPDFIIHELNWLPDGRIAWSGRQKAKHVKAQSDEYGTSEVTVSPKSARHVFADGNDVTGMLDFMALRSRDGRRRIAVRENGVRYMIGDYGSQEENRKDCCESLHRCRCRPNTSEAGSKPVRTQAKICCLGTRVSYRGRTGPEFAGIVSDPTLDGMAYTKDGSCVAYVGFSFSRTATVMSWFGHQAFGHMGYDLLDNSITRWPTALLMNPCFGLLHIYYDRFAKKYSVVDNDSVWETSFQTPPTGLFYSVFGQLLAVGHDGNKDRLYVDGKPGPVFDAIMNVRYIEQEGCICYGAKKGKGIFRVIV